MRGSSAGSCRLPRQGVPGPQCAADQISASVPTEGCKRESRKSGVGGAKASSGFGIAAASMFLLRELIMGGGNPASFIRLPAAEIVSGEVFGVMTAATGIAFGGDAC